MELLNNPSIRRLIALLSAPVVTALNKKFGIDVSDSLHEFLYGLIALFIVSSNAKEVAVKRSEAAGQAAADKIKTTEDAVAKINEASK